MTCGTADTEQYDNGNGARGFMDRWMRFVQLYVKLYVKLYEKVYGEK